jgi:regulator of sigma E protease
VIVLSILLIVVIFSFLVFVHELGHFLVARRNGVEVEEFGFGFPPRVLGRRIGDTDYTLNLIPLGGFVRMAGEDTDDIRPGTFGEARLFAKTKILLAGVGMNLLSAYVIVLVLCIFGLPPVIQNQFSLGHPTYGKPKQLMAAQVEPGSPAAKAGLKQGDIIDSADGVTMTNEDQLMAFTRRHAGEVVTLVVASNSQGHTVQVKLLPPNSKVGYLGIVPFQTYTLKYGWWSPAVALGLTGQLCWETLVAFGGLVAGLICHVTVCSQVSGPVGIVVILSNILNLGASYVLVFIAAISVSLAVVNVLPIPALDGGRLMLAVVRRLTNNVISAKAEAMVHAVGFILLLALMAVVTYFDIRRLG